MCVLEVLYHHAIFGGAQTSHDCFKFWQIGLSVNIAKMVGLLDRDIVTIED